MSRLLTLLAVLALLGCSGGGDDGGGGSSSTAPPTSGPAMSTGEAAGPGPEHRAFCEEYQVLDRLFDDLPDSSLAELQASVETLAQQSAEVAQGAPDEVAADAQVMADYFAEWHEAADAAETRGDAAGATAGLASIEAFHEAGQRLHGWVQENCPQ